MTGRSWRRLAVLLGTAGAALLALPVQQAVASWVASDAATASAVGDVLEAGPEPTAVAAGRTVTVSWSASGLTTAGVDATGYTVSRTDGTTTGAVTCAAPAELLRCVEHGLPTGSWSYRVTPAFHNWTGAAGTASAPATVAAPSFTITAGQHLHRGEAVGGPAVSNFDVGESVQFLLDGTGTPLATATVGADGTITPLALAVPVGATGGTHTISAVGTVSSAVSASFTVDVSAPVVTATPAGTAGTNGWYTTAVNVTVSATDGSGTGLASFTYTLDGGGAVTVSGISTVVALSTNGTHTINASATDNIGGTGSTTATVNIDLVSPTVSFTPSATMNRATSLSATATDATSGIASVRYEACAGSSCTPNVVLGSSTTSPSYGVTWPGGYADGTYQVWAVGVDNAGRATTSTKRSIVLDDTVPTASVATPTSGAVVGGTAVTFTATVDDAPSTWASSGANVQFWYKATASSTWLLLLDPTGATATGTKNMTGIADGTYDLEVIATDKAGNSVTSVSTGFSVQNWTANAVSTTNVVLGTKGRMDGGDTVVITYTQAIAVSSFCSTWSGDGSSQSLSATVTVADGGAGNDSLTVSAAGCLVNFGSLDLGAAGYVGSGGATFSATVSWTPGTKTLSISLGILPSGSITTEPTGGKATYTPSSLLQSTAGVPINPVTKQTTASGQQF